MNESILITGANAELGKETARQLALKKETKKVILFCRNRARAEAAKKDLEEKTGKKIFEIIIGDVTDANSVRKAVEEIKEPIDAIVLNAGGVVGKTAAKSTPSVHYRTKQFKISKTTLTSQGKYIWNGTKIKRW
jgi:short-subunit dehydrogenase